MTTLLKSTLTVLCGLLMAMQLHAAVAVIVNPDNANKPDKDEVRRIFLGKTKTFNDGTKAEPADLNTENPARAVFLKDVIRKNEASLNSYWARMLFSSKGKPPRQFDSAAGLQAWVLKTPGAIGYVEVAELNPSVKVAFIIE